MRMQHTELLHVAIHTNVGIQNLTLGEDVS